MHFPVEFFPTYLHIVQSYLHYSEIKDGGRRRLAFQYMRIWPLRHVDSAVFVISAKFGLNICYSH